MKVLAVLACVFVAVSLGQDKGELRSAFDKFVSDHGKLYSSPAEKAHRFQVFADNYIQMLAHNEKSAWKKGINQFSDLTAEEFKTFHLNGLLNTHKNAGTPSARSISPRDLPESVDWREKGAITEVKNQGACGSCWAFAATEQMESYVMINNGTLPVLSAQHITSCTPNPLSCGGTGGCMGSIPQLAWSYVQLFGLLSEDDWPYTSGSTADSGECEYDANTMTASATTRGYETLPHNSLEAVMDHIANVGPLAVSVDASAWSSYSSGVFDGCDYNQNININHAVQMVGYGTDAQEGDYWIVRNSWGSSWGEGGFIRLRRESTAVCGTDSTPLMGTACVDDGNDVQTTCGMCGVLFDTSYPIGAMQL